MSETLKTVDEGLVKEVQSYVKFKAEHGTETEKQTFSNIANYIPPTRSTLPLAVGPGQGSLIGTSLLPTIVASPDGNEQASFPTFGNESFYIGENDIVAPNSGRKSADFAVTWTSVGLDAHAMDAPVDIRLERAMAASGFSAANSALELARGQVENRKEKAISDLLQTASTTVYASSSHYATLTSTDLWSDAANVSLFAKVTGAVEQVRGACGIRPNTFWMGAQVFNALRYNKNILDIIKYSGTKAAPGAPATVEGLSAVFGMNILVGDAVNTATLGGSLADTWGKAAGLLVVGNDQLHTPKFGATFTAAGSPKVMPPYLDRTRGAEGVNVYSYVDYYKPFVTMKSAGYLWTAAVA